MADHMPIGFRVEFTDSGKLVASAYCEDAYLAAALPGPGTWSRRGSFPESFRRHGFRSRS